MTFQHPYSAGLSPAEFFYRSIIIYD